MIWLPLFIYMTMGYGLFRDYFRNKTNIFRDIYEEKSVSKSSSLIQTFSHSPHKLSDAKVDIVIKYFDFPKIDYIAIN